MKCFFQLISAKDGIRSGPIGAERAEFVEQLERAVELHIDMAQDLVLVLVDDVSEEEWSFSLAPLFTVASFIRAFKESSK